MNFLITILYGIAVKVLSAWGILFLINNVDLENTTQTIVGLAMILMILEFNLKSTNISINFEKGDK